MVNAVLDALLETHNSTVDESFKMWQRAFAMPKVMRYAMRTQVGATPHDVVYEEDSLKVLRYRNDAGTSYREPILICYALVNRPYILDLQPQRSVVSQLLKRGFNVYLIDWGIPTAA